MNQGGNPARNKHRNTGGKTIKERLSNITNAFQSDRKRRRPSYSVASPTIAAAAATSFSSRGSQERNRRALKSPALPYFVPTHTPDRPSRPVTDAPSEEECYALLSGKQQQQQQQQQQQGAATNTLSISYPTRHDSVGSSGHGSGVLVVHLDNDGPPAYEQPRPAPRPPPGSEERRQQQCYRSSPSPMRQNSTASSSRSVSPYHHYRHRDKELPPLRIGDDETAAQEQRRRRSSRWRNNDDGGDAAAHGGGDGGGQQLQGMLTPSPHAAEAAAACRLCYRACDQQRGTATLCRQHCELASAAIGSGSDSSDSHYGGENAAEQPLKNRPRDLGGSGSDHFPSRFGSFSVSVSSDDNSNSRGGSPFPAEVAQGVGVAFTAAPCSPREVQVVLGSPTSAPDRADVNANADPHHMFDFGFSPAAAEEQDNAGEAVSATGTATRHHRLVIVEQKPVIVDDDDEAALDWDAEWNPAYYFGGGAEQNGADGAGTGNNRLSSVV